MPITHDEIVARISHMADDAGGVVALARKFGVSDTYIGDVIAGKRAVGPKLLAAIGVERQVVYSDTTTKPTRKK